MSASNTGAFRFAIGEMVDHRDGRFPAIVHSRNVTRKSSGAYGPEFYGVILIEGPFAGEYRVIDGAVLVPYSGWMPPGGGATVATLYA